MICFDKIARSMLEIEQVKHQYYKGHITTSYRDKGTA